MSGPAKVALSLRHAMRRWLISLPAASDRSKRSAGFLSIPGIAIWKGCPDLPRSRCLCDTQCGDGSSLCRLHLIARSDLPASFPSQALPSGKDVRTCQGRAVFATRNAAMAHLSAGWHLIARSDLPASFPSQALPSGKDVRTCQGRAVFATRNAAMAHLSAGCTRICSDFLSGIAIWGARSRCLERNARCSLPAGSDRSKRSAGFLSIPGIAIWKGCPDLPRSRCLCDTQCGDGSSLCRLHLIARSDLPASFPSQALPSGKDVRTCQGRAVFATRNAAMAHLSAGCI